MDAQEKVDPTPPRKKHFLVLQFDRGELGRVGKHNFQGDTGGIKCTYHTLECSLKTSVVKIPKRKFFWNRITGTELLASLAMMMG